MMKMPRLFTVCDAYFMGLTHPRNLDTVMYIVYKITLHVGDGKGASIFIQTKIPISLEICHRENR